MKKHLCEKICSCVKLSERKNQEIYFYVLESFFFSMSAVGKMKKDIIKRYFFHIGKKKKKRKVKIKFILFSHFREEIVEKWKKIFIKK